MTHQEETSEELPSFSPLIGKVSPMILIDCIPMGMKISHCWMERNFHLSDVQPCKSKHESLKKHGLTVRIKQRRGSWRYLHLKKYHCNMRRIVFQSKRHSTIIIISALLGPPTAYRRQNKNMRKKQHRNINCVHRFIADYKNCNILVNIITKTKPYTIHGLHQDELNDKISSKYMNYLKAR